MGRVADRRIALTVRLPYDQYREVAHRAKVREWSISHYVSWCVARELAGSRVPDRRRIANLALETVRDASEQ